MVWWLNHDQTDNMYIYIYIYMLLYKNNIEIDTWHLGWVVAFSLGGPGLKSFLVTLAYEWNPKVIIYSLWIESMLMKTDSNRYYQYRHLVPLDDLKNMWS